jgi:hypothetical protein
MLLKESKPFSIPTGKMIFMSDVAIIAALIKSTLLEISKQELALGTGLQNAAPGDKSGVPNKSVQYLLDGADYFAKLALQCNDFFPNAQAGVDKKPKQK